MIRIEEDATYIVIPREPVNWTPGPALDVPRIMDALEARTTPTDALTISVELDRPLRDIERALIKLAKGGYVVRTPQNRWLYA